MVRHVLCPDEMAAETVQGVALALLVILALAWLVSLRRRGGT